MRGARASKMVCTRRAKIRSDTPATRPGLLSVRIHNPHLGITLTIVHNQTVH
jgi:hypothetical protein